MATAFTDLPLCPELQFQLQTLGYSSATPIQAEAIPSILQGGDLIAEAQTGTGKTAAFALPMIEQLSKTPASPDYHHIRGLVLVPTRELAVQVSENILAYGSTLSMRVISIYGGVRFDNQIRKMKRGADILVATPGRLLEMLNQKKFSLDHLETLVLDEADRMLDLGFIHDIKRIMQFAPKKRQTLLFSATLNERVEQLSQELLQQPIHIKATPRNTAKASVKQHAYAVDNGAKAETLIDLIDQDHWTKTLVFARTKRRAELLSQNLQEASISAASIHGDKSQKERQQALRQFIEGSVDILVATDVAARGLDIEALPRVINYDVPQQAEDYIHRIGRTGRAGAKGIAISLVSAEEKPLLQAIEALIGKPIHLTGVPRFENGQWVDMPLASKIRVSSKGKNSAKKRSATMPKSKPSSKNRSAHTDQRSPVVDDAPPKRSAARRSLFQK